MEMQPGIVYENTVSGQFLRRLNRFTAEVRVDGRTELVHVKNTGRLGELLLPEAEVTLQRTDSPARKTGFDLISVYRPGLEWVNIDSLAPNALMKQYLEGEGYDLVKPEYTWGDSRFDFYMERGGERYLTEVKGCTLAAGLEMAEVKGCTLAADLEKAGSKDVAPAADPAETVGLFPDAPTERGVKHLNELAAAAGEGIHCTIAFVIQMNGIHVVLPNDGTQPKFGQALARAAKAGVRIAYYGCRVEADSIRITGGQIGFPIGDMAFPIGKNAEVRVSH